MAQYGTVTITAQLNNTVGFGVIAQVYYSTSSVFTPTTNPNVANYLGAYNVVYNVNSSDLSTNYLTATIAVPVNALSFGVYIERVAGTAGSASSAALTYINGTAQVIYQDGTTGPTNVVATGTGTDTNNGENYREIDYNGIAVVAAAGPTGATGATGTTGATGAVGATGTSGTTGATGAVGATGTSGTTGATGAVGATGTSGTAGATGATGSTGTSGTAGATGAAGAAGTVGATGAAGAAGATGATGAAGAAGTVGATGAAGTVGATGAAGAAGASGATGATGSTGTSGTAGATGAAGATGTSGTVGAAGPSGATGPSGTAGAVGATGAPGTSGTTGATGAAGPSGTAGAVGATGAAGPAGPAGNVGATGSSGATGSPGPAGAIAASGQDLAATQVLFGAITHDITSPGGDIYALYQTILGRVPDALGLEADVAALNSGVPLATVAQWIVGSAEYTNDYGASTQSSNSAFVTQLYQDGLNRQPDSGGLQTWTNALANGSLTRGQVAVGIATSSEAQADMAPALQAGLFVPAASDAQIARLYDGILGRAPDAGGLASWETFAAQGNSLATIATDFLQSAEYTTHFGTTTDTQFVTALYQGALGRAPDAGGLQVYDNALANGASRASIAVSIAESPEATLHLAPTIETGMKLA